MTEENAEYTSDWTQNWNGSIAVKLTAIILWSVMVVAFFFTVPLMFSYEEEKLKEYLWVDQQLKLLIKQHLSGKYPVTGLEMHLKQYASDNNIQYIHVESENVEFDLGISSEKNYSFPSTRLSLDNGVVVSISVEHENLKKVIIIDRIVLGAGVLTGAAVFGLFIFIVTRKVVYNPMRKFVRLTHQLSKGEKDLRFDEARDDEFGELARFSNEMLDNLELQQARMVETNRELVSEIRHREEALAASQQKSAFLANMSHEIRTPLSSIIGYTERLRYKDIKNEYEKNDMLDIVLHSSNHLLSLINDILDFSKIEANKLEMEDEEFSIIEVITHTISLLHDKAMEQSTQINAEYDFPLPRVIHNDATRIKQVLLNLCGNALRFTQNGVITIIVSFDQKNNQIVIAVKDTGIGMSDEVIDKLFKPFSQADASTSKQFGGTGLGLVISRRLCELMGGDISVKSTEGLGSIFTFSVDAGFNDNDDLVYELDKNDTDKFEYSRPLENLALSGKVLLVEDTPAIRILVKAYLEDYGVKVSTAENGKEGVAMALEGDFDAVIMDIHMPVMNGTEAVKLLRSDDYPGPIIALTADALTQQVEEYRALGFSNVLTKPIIINELLGTLSEYLEASDVAVNSVDPVEDSLSAVNNLDIQKSPLNSELGKRLVKNFVNSIPESIEDINIAIDNRDIESLKDIFHQLKGLGGSVGFPVVTELATEVESQLANEDLQLVKMKTEELNGIYKKLSAMPG